MNDKLLSELSKKFNVLISQNFRILAGEREFNLNQKRNLGVGDRARYLFGFGLDPKDIAVILGAPVQSVRTLLTPKRRK
jgi:hypothetical protein